MIPAQPPVRLLSTAIDETILGDAAATQEFRATWESLDSKRRPLLVYNSSRSVNDIRWLILEGRIPPAEFIIGGLGTEVHDPLDGQAGVEFRATLGSDWDRSAVDSIVREVTSARLQPEEFLGPYKSSWYWPRASLAERAQLEVRLKAAGIDGVITYTGGALLDVTPRGAGKGNALAWLCRRIGVELQQVIVAGASANDVSMFALRGTRGVIVGNAASDLFAIAGALQPMVAREERARGVLAGLKRFGVLEFAGRETPSEFLQQR
jgi:sucrose-6F-phosphate phosphohydrolase